MECGIECDAQNGQVCVFPRTSMDMSGRKISHAKAELPKTPPRFGGHISGQENRLTVALATTAGYAGRMLKKKL